MPNGRCESPGETLGVASPVDAIFPANFGPELVPIFADAEPQATLDGKTKSPFGMHLPEGIDGLQILHGKLIDLGEVDPLPLDGGFSGKFTHFEEGQAIGGFKVLLGE